jgi:Tfp pilus assembly protein PilE
MAKLSFTKNESGIAFFELFIVFLLIIGLLFIIFATYSGVEAKSRNSTRQKNVNSIHQALEQYYAENNQYPTLTELNNTNWIKNNMKYLDHGLLKDPRGKDEQLSQSPTKNSYSYTVTSISGSQCNNTTVKCGQYIITAELEGGGKFTASSLN